MKRFYSLESEQIVLGSLIVYNNSWNNIYNFLTIENFYFENHKIIFSVILEFLNLNLNFDVLSIYSKIKFNFNFDFLNYLNYLVQKLPNPSAIFFYSTIIYNMYILRKILFVIKNFSNFIFNSNNLDLNSLLNNIESDIFNINKDYFKEKNNLSLISSVYKNFINNKFLLKNEIFLTGFKNLDDLIQGISRGDFLIIAGRPSTGKTSFSLNIAKHVANFYNLPVVIFSMEMSINQLFIRIISLILDKNQNEVINNLKNKNFIFNSDELFNKLNSLKIFIDDTSNLSILHIYTRCKYILKEYGDIGLIIIDYLQLMNSFGYIQNRVFEISEISRSLKCLAKELNAPLIVISQLNRNLELRTNKKPVISDLRESGSIEQDADMILFIYRDFMYNSSKIENKNLVEIIVGKHRNGSTGNIFLNFFDEKFKFFVN